MSLHNDAKASFCGGCTRAFTNGRMRCWIRLERMQQSGDPSAFPALIEWVMENLDDTSQYLMRDGGF